MRLSAPVYRLKRQAKLLSRQTKTGLHVALDRVAKNEGFESWSLLAAHAAKAATPAKTTLAALEDGDLLLLGARPGHGKTLLGLELALEAIRAGRHAAFFSLEYTTGETEAHTRTLGGNPDHLDIVTADDICADRIIAHLTGTPRGTLAVVDYLQALDHKRTNPPLSDQTAALRRFARQTGVVIAFIAQIDRSYDPLTKPLPDTADIRLPNAMDLSLFSKTCFLHNGEVALGATI